MMKKVFDFLYHVSIGVWVTSMFMAVYYGNRIPMWVALVVMNTLLLLSK